MRAYRQMAAHQGQDEGEGSDDRPAGPPTAVAVFAADNSIRSLLDPKNEMRWTEFDRGGHFPAMEAPDLLVNNVREFFQTLR
jgi:pimeloyl-ACP methyl ester carboxylesterase